MGGSALDAAPPVSAVLFASWEAAEVLEGVIMKWGRSEGFGWEGVGSGAD